MSKMLDSNPTPKIPKNAQLAPLKVESEQRIRLDEVNLNGGMYSNSTSQQNSAKNVKLNPIGSKK